MPCTTHYAAAVALLYRVSDPSLFLVLSWTVLCRSFPTFFIDGQAECEQAVDDMDWGTAKIYERIDGTTKAKFPFA